jgi:hypothetical protein
MMFAWFANLLEINSVLKQPIDIRVNLWTGALKAQHFETGPEQLSVTIDGDIARTFGVTNAPEGRE